MLGIKTDVELSEDTRSHSVNLITGQELLDVHEIDGIYYVCKQKSTEIIAILTIDFYNKLIR